MGKEQENTLCKDRRVIHLHKSNGVYHVRATALSELCPLEDLDPRNDDAPPAEAVGEANVAMDTKIAIQTYRGREVGTLDYPLAIQSLVFALCERVGT